VLPPVVVCPRVLSPVSDGAIHVAWRVTPVCSGCGISGCIVPSVSSPVLCPVCVSCVILGVLPPVVLSILNTIGWFCAV
jgi:hypothetical protein